MTINTNDTSTSINTQLDSLIPTSKIANLSQGMFVGAVSDNFGEKIEQKIFHAQIVVDNVKVAAEAKNYKPIPEITAFRYQQENDILQEQIQRNYNQIKMDVINIIEEEKDRIRRDPKLRHLLEEKN